MVKLDIEAMEIVEATEAIETAEVLRPGISIPRSSKSSRFLSSAFFLCVFIRILKYHVES